MIKKYVIMDDRGADAENATPKMLVASVIMDERGPSASCAVVAASICEHGRRKDRCKECGGPSFCEHARRRSECKKCRPPAAGDKRKR